ncbi:MAG: tRNA pseudouridine(55) synthase TruB [bacterium]|jgi:tRNA pseudouridine55 synthase
MNRTDPFDGILLVDKPAGPTSHDVVYKIRRHFNLKKVGHGGTLDPAATGLLVILLGRGTRVSNRFMTSDKTYEGTITLGVTTDSQDAEGVVLKETDASGITRAQLEDAISKFKGDMFQIPPMVSAIKMAGVPLYKLARKGEEIERKPRFIHLYEFRLLDYAPPCGTFVLRCSKGTYVRTLCHDIGEALGVGAHLSQLRRTESAGYNVSHAVTMDQLLSMQQVDLLNVVMPLHSLGGIIQED